MKMNPREFRKNQVRCVPIMHQYTDAAAMRRTSTRATICRMPQAEVDMVGMVTGSVAAGMAIPASTATSARIEMAGSPKVKR